jgi:hypothetical protein
VSVLNVDASAGQGGRQPLDKLYQLQRHFQTAAAVAAHIQHDVNSSGLSSDCIPKMERYGSHDGIFVVLCRLNRVVAHAAAAVFQTESIHVAPDAVCVEAESKLVRRLTSQLQILHKARRVRHLISQEVLHVVMKRLLHRAENRVKKLYFSWLATRAPMRSDLPLPSVAPDADVRIKPALAAVTTK